MPLSCRQPGPLPAFLLLVAAALGTSVSLADDPGNLIIVNVTITDDGTADPVCITGDPNPSNHPSLVEGCPGRTDAECDTPGQPGSGTCANVPDGLADRGETTDVRLTLYNASVVAQTSAPRALENLTVGIRPNPSTAACRRRGQVFVGTIAAKATFSTPPGALSFVVDPAAASTPPTMLLEITAEADDMDGLQPEPSVSLRLGIDRPDSARIAASCPGNAAENANGVLCEDFETQRNATPGFQFTRLAIGADPVDPLLARGDPNDDVLGYAQGTGVSPAGTGAVVEQDVPFSFATCVPVTKENDWHLHSPLEGPGEGYDPPNRPGIGAPDGGKAHSGLRSMHWGRHLDATDTIFDTFRLRQVAAFVLDPPVNIGPATTLDFWHIMSVLDDEIQGQPPPGRAFMGGQVQVSLRGEDGRFERWRVLQPTLNPYNSLVQETFAVCQFDPGDDQQFPNDETMCEESPLWSDIGGVDYDDATCVTTGPYYFDDCGDISCSPGPGCTENGATGTGVWARSVFDLSPFAGRQARLRWIGMTAGGWGFGADLSPLELPGHIQYWYYEGDDGWWIDDIKLTDLRVAPPVAYPDPSTGPETCQREDPLNCGAIAISLADSFPGQGGRWLLGVVVFPQSIAIDARPSTAGDDPGTPAVEGACDFGMLEFQVTELDTSGAPVAIISPWSPAAPVMVAPSHETLYRVESRCSSDPDCTATLEVQAVIYPDINEVQVTGAATSVIRWTARVQPPGIAGYDVFRHPSGQSIGVDPFPAGVFSGSCFEPDIPQATAGSFVDTADTAIPDAGTAYMYQVSHSAQAAGAINSLGMRPAASPLSGQVVMAGVACP